MQCSRTHMCIRMTAVQATFKGVSVCVCVIISLPQSPLMPSVRCSVSI